METSILCLIGMYIMQDLKKMVVFYSRSHLRLHETQLDIVMDMSEAPHVYLK